MGILGNAGLSLAFPLAVEIAISQNQSNISVNSTCLSSTTRRVIDRSAFLLEFGEHTAKNLNLSFSPRLSSCLILFAATLMSSVGKLSGQ